MMSSQPRLEMLDENWNRGLAVVAHPDDLEYGAASAIARWTSQGKEIAYVLVTCGEKGIDGMGPGQAGEVRSEEERRSAAVVGVNNVEFLNREDGIIEYGLHLRRDIARMIRKYRPDVIVSINFHLTWGGSHLNMADHRVVGLAVLDAARDAGNRWIFPEFAAEGLEPWPGAHVACFSGSPNPTHAVDVTGHIDRGIASLREHAAYIAGLGGKFDPDSFLRGAARSAGTRAGCDLAVTFEVFSI
jgi:LmbE family N-acetylglucosaminyl deacetylase